MGVTMLLFMILLISIVLSLFNIALCKAIDEIKAMRQENKELVELGKILDKTH